MVINHLLIGMILQVVAEDWTQTIRLEKLPESPVNLTKNQNGCKRFPPTWRLGYVVNNHGDVSKSPRPGVVGPLPNGRTSWLIHGGDPKYLPVLG